MTVRYFTTKAQATGALLPAQRVMFAKGKGYYCSWQPVAAAAPGKYTPPAGATVVSNGVMFASALASASAPIVLSDGVFDNPSAFDNWSAVPVYAGTPGKAVLTAGMTVGGNYAKPGGVLQGAVFDVTDPAKAATDGGAQACVNIWGNATGFSLLDVTVKGGGVLASGADIRQCDGLVMARCVGGGGKDGFTGNGFRVSDNNSLSTAVIKQITDITAAGGTVYQNGQQGCALWVGHPALTFARLHLSGGATGPLWRGNAYKDTLLTDVTCVDAQTADYCEHYVRSSVMQRFYWELRPGGIGANGEWDYGTLNNEAADSDTWQGGVVKWGKAGFDFDEGTKSPTVDYVTFVEQTEAAIVAYENIGTDSFTNNDYSQLASGAVPVSNDHV